ncbi:MAG: hypothetical protein QXI12_04645 [Candidatus Methanomethyliaceae archaeon]
MEGLNLLLPSLGDAAYRGVGVAETYKVPHDLSDLALGHPAEYGNDQEVRQVRNSSGVGGKKRGSEATLTVPEGCGASPVCLKKGFLLQEKEDLQLLDHQLPHFLENRHQLLSIHRGDLLSSEGTRHRL